MRRDVGHIRFDRSRFGFYRKYHQKKICGRLLLHFRIIHLKRQLGLPFRYKLKVGKNGEYNRELLIDRREKSKSLAWSSVVLAFENSKRISEEVKKPKALGDIRGVSYIYPILWRLGLIRVPEAIEKKMGKQR
ncbi:MAG: hypothetical protein ACLVH3_17040 [Blautia obeum]